jgi:acyl-CoA synthetase (AMP-forming)/AMP-acid ligase II
MAPLGLLGAMVRAGIIAPLRPDKYLRIAALARREGLSVTMGFAMSAQRCPNRPALVDELPRSSTGKIVRRHLLSHINPTSL